MDLSSYYLRLCWGARSFRSLEFDLLAERMNVERALSRDRGNRYYKLPGRVAALNLGNKVVIGEKYFESLGDAHRVAVVAHEFGHMLHRDQGRWFRKSLATGSLSCLAVLGIALALTGSLPLSVLASLVGFTLTLELSSRAASRRMGEFEMKCDETASEYVDGNILAETLLLARPFTLHGILRKRQGNSRRRESLEVRVSALRALGSIPQSTGAPEPLGRSYGKQERPELVHSVTNPQM